VCYACRGERTILLLYGSSAALQQRDARAQQREATIGVARDDIFAVTVLPLLPSPRRWLLIALTIRCCYERAICRAGFAADDDMRCHALPCCYGADADATILRDLRTYSPRRYAISCAFSSRLLMLLPI